MDVARATGEVARVLRPGGTFGLLWNLRDERVPWMAELGSVFGGDDVHHRRALALAGEAARRRWQLWTTSDVISETVTRCSTMQVPARFRVIRICRP